MPGQLDLDLDIPSLLRPPAEDRPEPLFWFRELRILSAFSPDPGHLVRSIPFRRGLNIVWSPPPSGDAPADRRASGHASGKTALCRLLRGLLGEERLGTPEVVESIRQSFPGGWVAAALRVGGRDWCVARPFAALRRSRAAESADLDAFLSDEKAPNRWNSYLDALRAAAREIVPLDRLPGLPELTPWHFFPWFSRDQDTQYMKLCEWRDNPVSESDSPLLTQEQKGLLLRAVLSVGSEEESRLLEERKALAARRDDAVSRRQHLARSVREDSDRIAAASGLQPAEFDSPLAANGLQERLLRERKEILDEAAGDGRIAALRTQADRLAAELANARQQRAAAARAWNHENLLFQKMASDENRKPEYDELEETIKALAAENPGNQFCCAPIDLALQENCPLALRFHSATDEEFGEKLAAIAKNPAKLADRRETVRKLKEAFLRWNARAEELADGKDQIDRRISGLRRAALARAEEKADLWALVRRFSEERTWLGQAEQECREIEAKAETLSQRLKASRDRAKSALAALQGVYGEVIRYVLGPGLDGSCTLFDGQFQVRCLLRGTVCSSAAFNAVSVLGFDIAALALACQGQSRHPRFLIHDGPRVADLSPSIYLRFFEFIRDLESLAGSREPNFQYIVTTTEPPPPELQRTPFLACTLDSSLPGGAGRLFGRDLSRP